MNNELVAWINVEKRRLEWDKPTLWETPTVVKLDRIPLYTHPVKEQLTEIELEATFNRGYKEGAMDYASKCNPVKKQLTDEEIIEIYCQIGGDKEWAIGGMNDAMPFARAILRKAQENG